MITIHIYGKDYLAPRAIDNDAAALGAFEADIRSQLETLAKNAGIEKSPVDRSVIVDGEYVYDADGSIKTVREFHHLTLPDALHEQVVLPGAAGGEPASEPTVADAPIASLPDEET